MPRSARSSSVEGTSRRLWARLESVSPMRVLERGYAMVWDAGGAPVTAAALAPVRRAFAGAVQRRRGRRASHRRQQGAKTPRTKKPGKTRRQTRKAVVKHRPTFPQPVMLGAPPAFAFDLTIGGKLEQGGIVLVGTAPAGATVTFDNGQMCRSRTTAASSSASTATLPTADADDVVPGGAAETRDAVRLPNANGRSSGSTACPRNW